MAKDEVTPTASPTGAAILGAFFFLSGVFRRGGRCRVLAARHMHRLCLAGHFQELPKARKGRRVDGSHKVALCGHNTQEVLEWV
jgi:hypothetical protein